MRRRTLFTVCLVLLIAGIAPALAHDDERITGTVTQVTLTGLVVKPASRQPVSIALGPSTKVTKNGRKASVLDLKAGMAVIVDAHENDDGSLVAVEVTIVPPPAGK